MGVVYASYGLLCSICYPQYEDIVSKSLTTMLGTQFGTKIASNFMDNSIEPLMVNLGRGSAEALKLVNSLVTADTS